MSYSILTAGFFYLDTVAVREYPKGPVFQRIFSDNVIFTEVGATCGNVTTILSWFGNKVYPIAHFDLSDEGIKLTDDLKRYGCDCRFVRNDIKGGVTTLLCTHKQNPDGTRKITFRRGSPGGSRFPKDKFIRAKDEAPELLEKLDFIPDIFFYDSPSAGHRVIAKDLRTKGTIVYYEPEHWDGTNTETECIRVSDIIKFSGERITDTSFADQYSDKLFIQTLGSKGIRFKLRDGKWTDIAPIECQKVVDWEGAGDWTSAAFINFLCKRGYHSINEMTSEIVNEGLIEAQQYASKSVGFLGSKGMIHKI